MSLEIDMVRFNNGIILPTFNYGSFLSFLLWLFSGFLLSFSLSFGRGVLFSLFSGRAPVRKTLKNSPKIILHFLKSLCSSPTMGTCLGRKISGRFLHNARLSS